MRILVIGATGLLGKEIAGLLSRDHAVIGASRKRPALTVRGGRHHRPSTLSPQLRRPAR
jgi:uncharacterized protein YbjT (DUF2867 family)